MLMPIRSIEQRSRRTNLDAIAPLRTIQPAAERANDRVRATIARFDGFFTHPLIAHARAALAEDAALRIVGDHRRKILLRLRILAFDESFFEIPPVESQFLQYAFAAAIAHRTIERMICQQKFEHRTLRLFD